MRRMTATATVIVVLVAATMVGLAIVVGSEIGRAVVPGA